MLIVPFNQLTGDQCIKNSTELDKENEGTIKSEHVDADNSGKPDSTTTANNSEQISDGRRISGSGSKDGRRFKDVR